MNILTQFKDLLFESLKENKKLIIVLFVLFIILIIAGWVLSADMISNATNTVTSSNTSIVGNPSTGDDDAISLFIHNELGGIITYVSSVFFAIPAIVSLIYNGINLGITGQLLSKVLPNGGLRFIIYLIPHGIFEITATVIQSVAGILLFLFIWRFIKAIRSDETEGLSDSFEKTKKILIQSIILMIFSTILLIIAAPIEAYISVPFSEFIMGFLI